MKKIRITAWILSALLCISLFTVPALADENAGDTEESFEVYSPEDFLVFDEEAQETDTIEEATAGTTEISSVTLKHKYKIYTGSAITQNGTTVVKAVVNGKTKTLKRGTDYTIKYKNNTNVGKATMIVTGKGNYTGTIKKTFYIYPEITAEQVIVPDYKYNSEYGYWQTGCYLKITAKQGSKTIWTRKTGTEIAAQLTTSKVYGYNKYGTYYYASNKKVVAVDILTGKIKWTTKAILGAGSSAAVDGSGNIYVTKQSNPNGDKSKAILYKINKNGEIVKKINWSDGGKYSGSTSGGAGVEGIENGYVVMNVELNNQWFTYRTIYIKPSTGKVVKVTA